MSDQGVFVIGTIMLMPAWLESGFGSSTVAPNSSANSFQTYFQPYIRVCSLTLSIIFITRGAFQPLLYISYLSKKYRPIGSYSPLLREAHLTLRTEFRNQTRIELEPGGLDFPVPFEWIA